MKAIKIFSIITIIIISFLYSCTDIIKLDLKNTEPRIVIEAVLNMTDSTFKTDITLSNGFYESGDLERIKGANVVLSKTNRETYTVPETENGVYFIKNIISETNDEFSLTVTLPDGKTFEANTIAPYPVNIINIIPQPFDPPGGNPHGSDTAKYYQILTLWKDTPNVDNFYRLKTYVNGEFGSDEYALLDDRYNEGDTIGGMEIIEIYSKDTFKLELLSTDEKYFKYFMDLANIKFSDGSATPFNPKGNFNNGALGYFGIYYSDGIEFVLP